MQMNGQIVEINVSFFATTRSEQDYELRVQPESCLVFQQEKMTNIRDRICGSLGATLQIVPIH